MSEQIKKWCDAIMFHEDDLELGTCKTLKMITDESRRLTAEIEQLRVQLAGCGVAAMQNTAESIKGRAVEGDYGYSASYSDVCRAVDREIRYREALRRIVSDPEVAIYRYCVEVAEEALAVAPI